MSRGGRSVHVYAARALALNKEADDQRGKSKHAQNTGEYQHQPKSQCDSFDLVPPPLRFAPTEGASCFALDDQYANKHTEDKSTKSCPHGDWFNCNLAHIGRALS